MGMMGGFPETLNVVVNTNHTLASKIIKAKKEENKLQLAKQAYDLAMLSQNMLSGNDLTSFINRSVDLAAKEFKISTKVKRGLASPFLVIRTI